MMRLLQTELFSAIGFVEFISRILTYIRYAAVLKTNSPSSCEKSLIMQQISEPFPQLASSNSFFVSSRNLVRCDTSVCGLRIKFS
jgi:5'(3')-deoxyribonucleotidase